jgi:hypothetical protein
MAGTATGWLRSSSSRAPSWEKVNREWDPNWEEGNPTTLPESLKRMIDSISSNSEAMIPISTDLARAALTLIDERLKNAQL